jgi:hypothetical protein
MRTRVSRGDGSEVEMDFDFALAMATPFYVDFI